MPDSTNPMNSGTAEQEQNGVTIPNSEASTLPTDSRFGREIAFLSPDFLFDPYVSNPLVKELIGLINQATAAFATVSPGFVTRKIAGRIMEGAGRTRAT